MNLPTPIARSRRLPHQQGGFTLVEMMVSTAILILLIVMVAQVTNSATNTITLSRNRLDADNEARMIFDRMASDFSTMVKRKDVDYICKGDNSPNDKTMAGNDRIFFYSEAPAFFSGTNNNSSVALVGYRITSSNPYYPNTPVLERLGKGLLRDGSGDGSDANPGSMVFLTYQTTETATTTPDPIEKTTLLGNWPTVFSDGSQDSGYHVIGSQVFRMEICYLLKPYKTDTGTVAAKYSNVPYNGTPYHTRVNGFQDVAAIVVGLAILDNSSRNMIPRITSSLAALTGKLKDPTDEDFSANPPALMSTTWLTATQQTNFAPTGTPKAAASQLRIYQRHFYLDSPTSN